MKDCRERTHIPTWCFSLYDFMVSVCESRAKAKRDGTEKKAYKHTDEFELHPTRAGEYCGGCSDYAIRRMARCLLEHGWLEVVKEPTDGRHGSGVYRVIRHKEWCSKHGFKDCRVYRYDPLTKQKVG